MKLKQLMDKIVFESNKLFLVDGIGAILSALGLGVVLVRLEKYFGIPSSTLYFLAILPIMFAIYDLYSYYQAKHKQTQLLKGIAIANILYCCLSLGALFYHIETITSLGYAYIILEILIVILLASIELLTAQKIKKNEFTPQKSHK